MSEQSFLPNRRDLLAASAAAGAFNALPTSVANAAEAGATRPFCFTASEEELTDLRRRIGATCWPDRETVDDRSQGNPGWPKLSSDRPISSSAVLPPA